MEDINSVVIAGHIFKAAASFPYKNKEKTGIYFPLIVNVQNGKSGVISIMVFREELLNFVKNYVHEGNKGKRISITGKLSFGKENSIVFTANEICFVDFLLSADEYAKRKENEVDFSED